MSDEAFGSVRVRASIALISVSAANRGRILTVQLPDEVLRAKVWNLGSTPASRLVQQALRKNCQLTQFQKMASILGDEQSNPDGQLQIGIQMIQQSYSRRVDDLMREVEHWKRVAQHHKQQEQQVQEQLSKTNQRAADLQRQLGDKQQECTVLTESRNVALSQITTLKKHAAQLQTFKKNISNMLSAEPGMDGLAMNVQGMIDNLPMDATFSSTLPSPALDAYSAGGRTSQSYVSDTYIPPSSATPGFSHTTAPPRATTPSAPGAASSPEVTLDAATYYQQVKRVLEPDQFRDFSANIKKLNAGHQSVDETLQKVREIFGEHRPFLFAQLQKLIRQAEDEARKQQDETM